MDIKRINSIVTTRGQAVALKSARAAMMPQWVIEKLKAGKWDVNHKPAKTVAPREVRTIVDRVGDKRIVKTVLGAEVLGYSIETLGESGDVVSREGLGKMSLAEARALIGKVIAHAPPKVGKTNVPGQGPAKGPSPAVQVHGSGQPKKKGK